MSDFSDAPFVAGSLVGLRAFSVDTLGRLCGPTFHAVFGPGENQAHCHRGASSRLSFSAALSALNAENEVRETLSPPKSNPDHPVGKQTCGCGYYAYFDGSNTYAHQTRVTAIIEGYGTCTVGSRGFRAEKARLLALVIPQGPRNRLHPAIYDRFADWLYRTSAGPIVGLFSLLLGVFCVAVSVGLTVDVSPWFLPLVLPAVALLALGPLALKADFHGIDRRYPRSRDVKRCGDHALPDRNERFALVRRNYPDVPVFTTTEAALKAFPLTTQAEPTPETDDNFWTRSVTA